MPRLKKLIERAYWEGPGLGLIVWCKDEAGPCQAIPQPGQSWAPVGRPVKYPSDYVRGGTAQWLTLFHPASGQVNVRAVTRIPNTVLHPWLKTELTAVIAALLSVNEAVRIQDPTQRQVA